MIPLWTSAELREATKGRLESESGVTGISIDTRSLKVGDLFIALVGEHSDGHVHVATALEKGAACVMVHGMQAKDDPHLLHVEDTMEGLRALGRAARARFNGKMVAVTGSVGKTTTKNMLKCALSTYGLTHAAAASFNNHWGVPLTLASMPRNTLYCVTEIGMNHRGEIAPLAAMVRPDTAVITTIGSAHLGHMGSVLAIAEEKSDLIAALAPDGVALIPDDTGMTAIFEKAADKAGCRLELVGQSAEARFRLTSLKGISSGTHFKFKNHTVTLNAPGPHLARNAGLVLATLSVMGLALDSAITALQDWRPDAGRGQIQPILGGAAALLDESYNASVLSIRAALETLSLVPARRRITVLGDILELGEFANAEHLSLVPDILTHADLVFCCGGAMRQVYDALPCDRRGAWRIDAASLAPIVQSSLKDGDVVLVKGSLGSRMGHVVASLLEGRAPN